MKGHSKISALSAAAALAVAGVAAGTPAAEAKKETAPPAFDFEHVSCTGAPNEIRVVIGGLKESVGLVTVDLYANNDDGFLNKRGRVGRKRAAAKAPHTSVCLAAPAPGEYAIAVYHDENANRDFDKGAFGLPAEPWGISNNPKVRFGPPHVSEALFPVDAEGGAKVFIDLN